MTIWSFDLKINGVNVATYGAAAVELRGNWDGPVVSFDEAVMPGRGTVATSLTPTPDPLDLVAVLELNAANDQALEDAWDAFKFALYGATVTVIAGNQEARQRTGVVLGSPSKIPSPVRDRLQAEIRIRCRDPLAYATSATTVTGAINTDVDTPLGLAASLPVLTITSPSTGFTVTYKNSASATVQTMTFTFAGSPTTFVIDCANLTVTVDGVRHDEYLTAGDFFALNPHDGVPSSSAWPKVRTSSGSGGTALSVTYTKAYQ